MINIHLNTKRHIGKTVFSVGLLFYNSQTFQSWKHSHLSWWYSVLICLAQTSGHLFLLPLYPHSFQTRWDSVEGLELSFQCQPKHPWVMTICYRLFVPHWGRYIFSNVSHNIFIACKEPWCWIFVCSESLEYRVLFIK